MIKLEKTDFLYLTILLLIVLCLTVKIKFYERPREYSVKLFGIKYEKENSKCVFTIGKTQYCRSYYENGNLNEKAKKVNGMLNGNGTAFYDNGIIQLTGYFVDDKQHGPFMYYYKDGTIMAKVRYEDDIEKESVWFAKDGSVISRGTLPYEKANGTFLSAYKNKIVFRYDFISKAKYIIETKDGNIIGIKDLSVKQINDLSTE